jgi:hypothetical protein
MRYVMVLPSTVTLEEELSVWFSTGIKWERSMRSLTRSISAVFVGSDDGTGQ